MGIDYHALKFLQFAASSRELGNVATIGRQRLYVNPAHLKKTLQIEDASPHAGFCEDFLRDYFKARSVESFDASSYEDATHICDMNCAIEHDKQYDTVLDFGTLEHVYNVPQAMKNISSLCAEGGQIIHVLPTNNHCGHGFWQLSPELFFAVYSANNGYSDIQVFLANTDDHRHWYSVKKPSDGKRVTVVSGCPLYVLVRTRRVAAFKHDNIQQSDYVHMWETKQDSDNIRIKQWVKGSAAMYSAASYIRRKATRLGRLKFGRSSLSNRNPGLKKVVIDTILSRLPMQSS